MWIKIISGFFLVGLANGENLGCTGSNQPICPPQTDNETYFFPNPRNCSTYFVCSNGCPIELNCPPDLHFSVELRTCTYPIDAKCNEVPIEQLYPVYCAVGAVMPNPHDCGSYLFCVGDNFADVMPCPPATKFSKSLSVCDWTENVTC